MTEALTIPAVKNEPAKTPDAGISPLSTKEINNKPQPFVQTKLTVGAPDDPYEKEADAVADKVMRMPDKNFLQRKCAECEKEETVQRTTDKPFVQRRLSVTDTNPANMPANDVADTIPLADKITHFNTVVQSLCPSYTVNSTGLVVPVSNPAPAPAALAASSTPVGCCGIDVLVNSANDWEIQTSQLLGPHTEPGNHVFVLPPANSDIRFGNFTAADTRVEINDVIVAGHEMVGHGAQIELGIHNQGAEDRESFNHHDPTVRIQNIIAHEQGIPSSQDRGLAAGNVHRGESFAIVEIKEFPFNSSSITQLPQAEQDKIKLIADFIRTNNSWVDVIGHSDPVGSASGKQQVSDNRANSVRAKLNQLGVTNFFSKTLPTYQYTGRRRFSRVTGVSDTQPPVTGSANHANWRRVEIFVPNHPTGMEVPPADVPALQQATPGANLATTRSSTNPCHQLIANSAFPVPAATTAPAPVQPKLMVGEQNNPMEREADAVSDKVMRMPDKNFLQRKCAECEEKGKKLQRQTSIDKNIFIQRFKQKEEESIVQAKFMNGSSFMQAKSETDKKKADIQHYEISKSKTPVIHTKAENIVPDVSDTLASSIESSRGSGSAMDASTSSFMQNRFGTDFSDVKIHTDAPSVQMNRELNAKAFTVGSDVYFNEGQYQPGSDSGKYLLAHELTHVVQQSNNVVNRVIQRKPMEELPKYPTVVNYKKARGENLASWYERYKFYNLFKEKEIYPGSTPVAYANKVYELQMKLEEITAGKWTAAEAGILEPIINKSSTLMQLMATAELYHKDKSNSFGFDVILLERMHKYWAAFDPAAPPLVSDYFTGVSQLESVNRNENFYINFDDRGEYVRRLQLALITLNYNIGADAKLDTTTNEKIPTGVFGKGTKEAVLNFQKNSGFEGKQADGIVGQMTLRFLDKRLGAPLYKQTTTGSYFVFPVQVTADDLLKDKEVMKTEFLKRFLQVAFPITPDQANVLINSGWHWTKYSEITQDDVSRGFKKVSVPKSDYEGIVGKAEGGTGEEISQKLEVQALDLLKAGKIYELNKMIQKKKTELGGIAIGMSAGGDGKGMPSRSEREDDKKSMAEMKKIQSEIDELTAQRDAELRRLGITLDEYEKLKAGFVENFEKFAAQTAFKMLGENEMQANIEEGHYKKAEEVQAIKVVLKDLSVKYSESEKLWWESVSKEDGHDSGYYKNQGEYIGKNTESYDGPGGSTKTETTYKTENFYNEQTVSAKYKQLESNPSPHFEGWKLKEKEVVETLQEAVKKFPILAYPRLELRRNAGKKAATDDGALQTELQQIISNSDKKGIKDSIQTTKEEIRNDFSKVWKLPIVIMRAKYELGVMEGTVLDKIINDKQEAVNTKEFWENIGWAVLGIGLGLLALASGPVGWLALGASIGVGAYDAYRTYNEITFKKQLSNTAINPADALGTEDPTYFWFWVSLVCVGLDVMQAAKLVKSIAKGAELAKDVETGLNTLRKALEQELETVGKTSERGKQIIKEIQEADEALTKIKTSEFIENQKLLDPLKSNPMAVIVMNEALKDKKIVKAITSVGKILDKEAFESVLKFYAGFGKKSIDELPELVRLIEKGGLNKNPELIKDIFADTRLQRVLLDTQDTELFAAKYTAWQEAIKKGESISLIQFLEKQGLKPGFAGDRKLVEMFGEAFAALPNATKNKQILQAIEPELLNAFNAGTLPKEIQRAMEVMLNSEVLAQSSRISSAQQRLLYEIKIIGSVIETPSEFSKVMILLDNPTARKALWDGATQLAGKDAYMTKIFGILKDKPLPPDVFDDMIRIGPMTDDGTIALLLEEKSKELRKLLAANPEAVAVLKKCASPCLPASLFSNPGDVLKVNNIMKGKSPEEILKVREYLYGLRDNEEAFRKAIQELETDYASVMASLKPAVITKPAKLKVSEETLRSIIDLGLPVSELNKILQKASTIATGEEMLYQLRKVMDLQKYVPTPNFNKLLAGLSSTNPAEFRAAEHLLDEASNFVYASEVGGISFRYTGLQKADILLGKFTLSELSTLMNMRWEEGFVNTLHDAVQKIPGLKPSELIDLGNKAGTGIQGNFGRLSEIINTSEKATLTYDEALKLVEKANALRDDVAKALADKDAFKKLAEFIWEETNIVNGDAIEIAAKLNGSGSEILKRANKLGKTDIIAEKLLSGNAIDKTKWEVFRKVIASSDIDQVLKNKLIGDMWEAVNIKVLEKEGFKLGETLFTQITMKAGKTTARADAVLIKGKEIIIVEFKTGGNVYRKGQTEIYEMIKNGDFSTILLTGNESVASKFADQAFKKTYKPIEESKVIGVH